MVTAYEVAMVAEALRRGLPVPDDLLRPVLAHVLTRMRAEQVPGTAWRHPAEAGSGQAVRVPQAVGQAVAEHRASGVGQAVRVPQAVAGQAVRTALRHPKPARR